MISDAATLDIDVPLVVMTYTNPVGHMGYRRFAAALRDAGIAGAILPDLPLDELDGWADAADAHDVETVLLAAPTTPDDRLVAICERSRGFVYGVSLMGVTGERATAGHARPSRDGPTAQGGDRQARAARDRDLQRRAGGRGGAATATVWSSGARSMARVLNGGGPEAAQEFVGEIRARPRPVLSAP